MLESIWAFNVIEKRLQHRCFPMNVAKFLRTAFFIEHLWWLLPETLIHRNLLSVAKVPISGSLENVTVNFVKNIFIALDMLT